MWCSACRKTLRFVNSAPCIHVASSGRASRLPTPAISPYLLKSFSIKCSQKTRREILMRGHHEFTKLCKVYATANDWVVSHFPASLAYRQRLAPAGVNTTKRDVRLGDMSDVIQSERPQHPVYGETSFQLSSVHLIQSFISASSSQQSYQGYVEVSQPPQPREPSASEGFSARFVNIVVLKRRDERVGFPHAIRQRAAPAGNLYPWWEALPTAAGPGLPVEPATKNKEMGRLGLPPRHRLLHQKLRQQRRKFNTFILAT